MKEQSNITNSLAHTKWNCKYHIVFAPKYRRKVFYEEKRLEIREILRKLCQWKGVDIIEGEICPDHIHMLVSIPPKMSVSGFMGYLKGKSSLIMISERKEQFDNIPKMGEYEVCVPKPRILVQGVLCGHSREKYCSHKGVYRKPIKAR